MKMGEIGRFWRCNAKKDAAEGRDLRIYIKLKDILVDKNTNFRLLHLGRIV